MRIDIKLYGALKRYSPLGSNAFSLLLDPGTTVGDVHEILSIPDQNHVLLVNGKRVRKEQALADADTVVLMPPVSGG